MRFKKGLVGLTWIFFIVLSLGIENSPSKAATYNYPVATVSQKPYAYLYNNKGERIIGRLLPDNTDWQVNGLRYFNGGSDNFHQQLMYQVSASEWLRADQSQANFDVLTGQLLVTIPQQGSVVHEMLVELNRLRIQNNLQPLMANEQLNNFSQQRAQALKQQGYLSHNGWWLESHPQGYAAENIETAFNLYNNKKNALNAIAEFYDDPGNPNLGHRKSMLNPYFTQVGMGIVPDNYGRFYIVQTFLKPAIEPDELAGIQDYEKYVQEIGERAPYLSHYDNAKTAIIQR